MQKRPDEGARIFHAASTNASADARHARTARIGWLDVETEVPVSESASVSEPEAGSEPEAEAEAKRELEPEGATETEAAGDSIAHRADCEQAARR